MLDVQSLPRDATCIWVASHVTMLFAPESLRAKKFHNWRDVLVIGSKGLGFSIDAGVVTEVYPAQGQSRQHEVWFNKVKVPLSQATVSNRALKLLEEVVGKLPPTRIHHQFEVPMGGGFGTSAAGVLGLLTGIRNLYELSVSDEELFQLAHAAEVLEKGGLGDVLALYHGGFEHRIKAGAPGIGICRRYTDLEKNFVVLVKFFSQLETKSVLNNVTIIQTIKDVGNKTLSMLLRQPTSPDLNFLREAIREFDLTVGMMDEQVLRELSRAWSDGFLAGQVMIGNAVFVLLEKKMDNFGRMLRQFKKKGYKKFEIVEKTVKGVDIND